MIKKVKVTDLRVGMYIHDLGVPWLDHSFIRNQFLIQNESQIEKISQQNISEVFIDTTRGLDDTNAPTKDETESELMRQIINSVAEPELTPAPPIVDLQWMESRQIHAEAVSTVKSVLNDAYLCRKINLAQAVPVVMNMLQAAINKDDTLISLGRLKQRDNYTFQHSVSVSALLLTFCRSMGGFGENDLIEIGLAGMFHDIGKMKIPIRILDKPESLTEQEFTVMKRHVIEGMNYLRSAGGINESTLKLVAEHHERFDGTGYPRRISQKAISLLGQMAAIVDVYDAITSVRVYHTALEPVDALTRMYEWGDKHFDAALVQRFIKGVGIYPVGSLVRLESGRLAVVLRQNENNLLWPLVRVICDTEGDHHIDPHDLDLADPKCHDHIEKHEKPARWRIDPFQFIGKQASYR